jgi:hypothetical protein
VLQARRAIERAIVALTGGSNEREDL